MKSKTSWDIGYEGNYLQQLKIQFIFFSIQPVDCSRKDLDKEMSVLKVQE